MRIRTLRFVSSLLVALGLTASPAAAQAPTCVTDCQAKADACAGECVELSGANFADCQLTCAEALFVDCVVSCQDTNEVVWNDYQLIVPAAPRESEAGTE